MLVLETQAGSAAEGADLMIGDVLIGSAGKLFGEPSDLAATLYPIGTGGTVHLDIVRGGTRLTRRVPIGSTDSGEPDTEAA